ncbi:uncharacterized protein LOC143344008 isoform X2 [Colletes latitarsis]|uniref:uncharacterized protein LOC143344008 isoform X2 n=1 Tax=Colletes latitarsis TaxID=2605962 RepID=UPI00403721FC
MFNRFHFRRNNKKKYLESTLNFNKNYGKNKHEKINNILKSIRTLCDDSSSAEDTEPTVGLNSENHIKHLGKIVTENTKHNETRSKHNSECCNSSTEYSPKLLSDGNSKSKKRKTSKSSDDNVKEIQNSFMLSDNNVIKKSQNRTKPLLPVVSEDSDSDNYKQKTSDRKHLKFNESRKSRRSKIVDNNMRKQKNRNEESDSSDSNVELHEKYTEKKGKQCVALKSNKQNFINLHTNDIVSSSGEEFQKSKFAHASTSYKKIRKLPGVKTDCGQSCKSHSVSSKQTKDKTVIDKENSLYLKSNVIKILNKFRESCSEYELCIERVKWKHFKKELTYIESANNLINKVKNVINKFKVELDTQEKDLTSFYEEWSKNYNLQNRNYEDSPLNKNEVLQTADSKKNSSLSKNKSSSQEENLVSECDSEEIFFSDKNEETGEKSASIQISEKSVVDNSENMVHSEDNQPVSPILGSDKKKAISDELYVKDTSKAIDTGNKTCEECHEQENDNMNNSMQDIFEESIENVEAVDILKQKKNKLKEEASLVSKTNKDKMLPIKAGFDKGNMLTKSRETSGKPDNKYTNTNEMRNTMFKSFSSEETLTSKIDDNESIATVIIEKEIHNILNELNAEEQAKKAMLESDSEMFPNEECLSKNSNKNFMDNSSKKNDTVEFEKVKSNSKKKINNPETNPFDEDSSSDEKDTIIDTIIDEICAKRALLDSNSDDSMIPSYSNKPLCKTHKSGVNSENIHAKATLLASSNSESSNSDSECNLQVTKVNPSLNKQKEESKENSLDVKLSEFDSSISERVKRRRTGVKKNSELESDKKLMMNCYVAIEKLSEEILKKHADALNKSRHYLDAKNIKSLTNLDRLERDCKKTNSTRNSSSAIKIQKEKETEDTLLDHLMKVANGEFIGNSEEHSDSESMNPITEVQSNFPTTEELIMEADMATKKMLLNSSDSDKEYKNESENNNSDQEEKKIKTKSLKNTERKSLSSEMDNEDERNKSKWRQNKILTLKFSDSDSDIAREKLEKHRQKLREEAEDSHTDSSEYQKKIIKRKRRNRKITDSDSEIQLNDSESDSSKSLGLEDTSSNTDSSIGMKKKKTRKRKTNKSSDSSSSLSEKRSKVKRKRIKMMDSDSDDSSNSDGTKNSPKVPGTKGRKNIRKVLKDKHIADDTKQAAKQEEERLRRIAERQKLYNEMYEARLAGEEKVENLVLDFNPETKEELLSVDKNLVKRLKPHQAKGIKFMWDACFESLERIKSSSGSGCIIAHCMGLGKSLQVIALTHTLLAHEEETNIRTIMIVCPLSTVLNWYNEFNLWLKDIDNSDIDIYELTKYKKNIERKTQLQCWQRTGGVLLIGYEMFRNLSSTNNKMRKTMKEEILQCLIDPGPDMIVCDEGHLLKNEDSAISKSIKRIKTLRRVILTGTPLQNNLIEYHCMVQFIKPNLLGTKKEFLNRFANPITNGQFDDSTENDVKLMKKRAYVLHKMLKGSVQRFDYSVLMPFLPPKQEYVIFVSLTDVQIKLYRHYLDNFARQHRAAGGSLFADFQVLQRIWTHPVILRLHSEKTGKTLERKYSSSDSEGSLKDFIVDNSDCQSETTIESSTEDDDDDNDTSKNIKNTRSNNEEVDLISEPEECEKEEEWWSQFIQPEHYNDMRISAKLTLLFGILKECGQIGDKILVFSQSLYSLTLIEQFLEIIDDATQNGTSTESIDGHSGSWSLGLDYFRLDGQTSADNRNRWCKIFNKPSNTRARLFLISTRAGGLGINLTAANRVIIFDASWNPSHDVQSIFRVYRFGQKKPCYVYRFLAAGTMEEKIYNRQVTKLSLSCRVVDEQQIERHYSNHVLSELYKFEPNTTGEKPTLNLPKDRLLAEIFLKYKHFVENYHEHDSLLENKAEEELDEEERKQAWLEYEEEKEGKFMPMYPTMASISNSEFLNHYNLPTPLHFGTDYEKFQELIRKDYPNVTPECQQMMTTRVLKDMYTYWEQQTYHSASAHQFTNQNTGALQTLLRTQVPNLAQMSYVRNLNMNSNSENRDEIPLNNKNNDAKSTGDDDDIVEITSPTVSKKNKTQEE